MVERHVVLNAFRPSAPTDRPSVFAGRAALVKALTDALESDGACPVVYGDRGLGKTSLALQIARIALGDVELLQDIKCASRALPSDRRWTPFYVACSDATKTKNDILQKIINEAESYGCPYEMGKNALVSTVTTKKLKLKFFEHETQQRLEQASGRKYSHLSTEDQLIAVIDTLSSKGYNRVLMIVDELDRVVDTAGLASVIKNMSGPNIKFMLVGVSTSISALLADHESIQRTLMPAEVKRMQDAEIRAIVTKAVADLNNKGAGIMFDEDATSALVKAAAGFPWFVHVLGQEALMAAWDAGKKVVGMPELDSATSRLVRNRFAQQFSDTYTAAVGDSLQREMVLRLMAKWEQDDIHLSDIYRVAKTIGVSNPSVCKRDLLLKRYGNVLVDAPMRQRGVVRFRNSMFKRFVNLRSSIYEGCRESVEEAWDRRPRG